jgi:hypothetical protein
MITVDQNSSGTFGGWNLGTGQTGEPYMFWYPGWKNIPSTNASSNYTRRGGNAVGFGTWVVSIQGGVNLSWSGPRGKSPDIVPLVYNPANGPEANLGVTNQYMQTLTPPAGQPSNYWPGAFVPPTTDIAPPRKIWNFELGEYIPNDSFGEEIVISQWTNSQGITITRKSMAWSHQDFDDFLIVEYVLENTGSTTRNEVYLPLIATWKSNQTADQNTGGGLWWQWRDNSLDDHFKYTEAGNYVDGGAGGPVSVSAARARGLKLSYQFDGDSPFKGWDDTGEPWQKDLESSDLKEMGYPNGLLAAHAFVGLAPVAYASSAGIHSFNPADAAAGYVDPTGDQPSYQNWWQVRSTNDYDEPAPEGESPTAAWTKLTAATVKDNPTDVGGFTNAQVYGPWALAPGQKAKLVVAYVAGSGAEYGGPGNTPIDMWQWSLTADKASYLRGEQAIVEHTEHALFAYQSGYDIPDNPPDVDVVVKSDENAKVKLYWSGAADGAINNDYNAADIAGYRVYRGQRGTLTSAGPFSLVVDIPVGGPYPPGVTYTAGADWPVAAAEDDAALRTSLQNDAASGRVGARPGMYSWSDPNSNAGFSYFYSVRAYSAGHTTWTNNDGTKTFADLPARVQTHLRNGLEGPFSFSSQVQSGSPVLPYVPAADRMERDIVVVPNPYMANGTNEYGGAMKVRFVNVPTKAFVYIFNSAGQLIQVLRKLNETRSEISWDGRPYTTTRAIVGPGIYFYAVHSLSGASNGKIKTGTFVVVR